MRPAADEPQAAEIAASLEVIDATLAGEPVDPSRAELAELVLLVAGERPRPSHEFAFELDRRVENRFGATSKAAAKPKSRRKWPWVLAPAGGLAALAGIVLLIALTPSGTSSFSGPAAVSSSSGSSSDRALPALKGRPGNATSQTLRPGGSPRRGTASGIPGSPGLRPIPNGRKLIQSSQLSLGAPSRRIDTVAQEVYDVVGARHGFVNSSTVGASGGTTATGGIDGYARFQLTVPSATLPQTMTSLSRLRYATVLERTDKVEDVTGQLQAAKRHHHSARVRALERGVAYSKISLTIQAVAPSSGRRHDSHSGGGFTIDRAAHDALGALTVIGGIALIALAVLVPLAVVVALGWNVRAALRRRQREQALDLA